MADAHDCSSLGLDKGPNGVGQVTHFLSATRSLLIGSFRNLFRNDATVSIKGQTELWTEPSSKDLQDAATSSTGGDIYYSTAPQELWTEPLSKELQDAATCSTGERTYYSTAPQELWTEPLSKDLQDAATSSTCGDTYYSTAPQELWTEILSNDLQDATTSSTGEHTHDSTAPQKLSNEILSNDLQDLNFVSKTRSNAGESGFVEVRELGQSDLLLLQLLAEGGQAHVYFAECEKFSTPVVVKRLKYGNVDLYELLCRMEKLMKIRKENNSAICRVFGAGKDFVGNVWVVMERMAGDLRTLINSRMPFDYTNMPFDYNEPMPFDYINTITMMLHIAEGMEDLHRCGLIHADLKASNILVTTLIMDSREEEVDGWQETSESLYFYVKIGDFESSDGVAGTQFWRAPEVLQALRNDVKPILSPAADVYSYGMVCYELLTGRIPFGECAKSNYDVVLSGQRPELTAHVNLNMKKMLHACWDMEPRQRPGWTLIIETLKEELTLHTARSQQPKRSGRPRMKMEREEVEAAATTSKMPNLVVTSWEGAVAQGRRFPHRMEKFTDWKKKTVPEILPEILPIVKVILKLGKATKQDTYDISTGDKDQRFYYPWNTTFSKVLSTFANAWYVVQENWSNHLGRGAGEYLPRSTDRKTCARYAPMRMVMEICVNNALKPCNLLGPEAKYWLEKVLATSKEWKAFLTTLRTWRCQKKGALQRRKARRWKKKLQQASSAWEEVHVSLHACHVRSAIALTALEAVEKKMDRVCREEMKSQVC